MPYDGQELHGHAGYRLRLISITPELLEMEAIYGGTGQMPPLHLHPSQTERFEVLEGTVRTVIDDAARDYTAGESFEVPAGTVHQMAADPPARMRWEVRPALRTAEFFETLYGGDVPSDFVERFSAEIRFA
jgi:quercetin dioxygenase-like cupin family protein